MLIVKLNKGENINRALKRFKTKVKRTKLIKQIRDNQHFTKPSTKRREQLKKAIRTREYKEMLDNI
jgi:small subunit ribosomal protein S21